MTDKELIHLLHNDTVDQQLEEAQKELDTELLKPVSEQNYERIDALIQTIEIFTGDDQITTQMEERGLRLLNQKAMKNRSKRIRLIRGLVTCACVILLISNIYSYRTYGMNSFSVAYQILTGGVTIDFSKQESEAKENGNPYEVEMRTAYDKHQIEGLVPAYIPSGFQPTDSFGSSYNMKNETHLFFNMKNQKKELNILVVQFRDLNSIPPLGIASDQLNITEQNINGTIVYISKEDQQYTAVFMIDTTQYILSADGVDYDECYHVLSSMFSKIN